MRRSVHIILFYWLPLLAWMVWIYWLSARPSLPHPNRGAGLSDDLFDYPAHAFTFGALTWLAWRAYSAQRTLGDKTPADPVGICRGAPFRAGQDSWAASWAPCVAGLFAALYAGLDEVHQMFVPGRWAKIEDWLADLVGILIAIGLIVAWTWLRATRTQTAPDYPCRS